MGKECDNCGKTRHLEGVCRAPAKGADAGAGKADVANQNNSNSPPSTPSQDPWICGKCYEVCEDGRLKKCPSFKAFMPQKDKDKAADPQVGDVQRITEMPSQHGPGQ